MTTDYNPSRVRDLLTRQIDPTFLIATVEVGSSAIGVSSPSTDDDLDLTCIYFEPDFHSLLWTPPDRSNPQLRTQPDGHRSRFGDIDINLYSLRRFANLMLKANPSILGTIFSPRVHFSTPAWDALLAAHPLIAARHPAGDAYIGYATQQIERWRGTRGQKNVSRPELVEAHGYDKYAYHAIRLAIQGQEYLSTGKLTLPPSGKLAELLLDVREGRVSEAAALDLAERHLALLESVHANSPLPDRPNATGFLKSVTDIYTKHGPVW